MNKRACICYLTWNRFEYTKSSLKSIIENTERNSYDMIIWDNYSTELGMVDWLKQICLDNDFKYMFFKRNEGLTRAMNNQMKIMNKMQEYDVFCHISNDIIVPKNWLNGVFEAISSKKVGVVGLNLEENTMLEKVNVDGIELEKIKPEGNVGGMHFCIPKWIYNILGGFKHVNYGYGQQDANYSLQVKLLPFDVWDYYLPLNKYKGEDLSITNPIYDEYQKRRNIRLKKSGSDMQAGRRYRDDLRKARAEYDANKITAEELTTRLKDSSPFLNVDKSQLLETNVSQEYIE